MTTELGRTRASLVAPAVVVIVVMATTMIVPEIGREKKMEMSPCEPIKDWRTERSARGPRTIANTAGASG